VCNAWFTSTELKQYMMHQMLTVEMAQSWPQRSCRACSKAAETLSSVHAQDMLAGWLAARQVQQVNLMK
jgi:hypothetical protein